MQSGETLNFSVFSSANPYVWIFHDQFGSRQTSLRKYGVQCTEFDKPMHSFGQLLHLKRLLAHQKPDLIYVRLAGAGIGSGNKKDVRRALFLTQLLLLQKQEGRHVLIEARNNSEAWSLAPYVELLKTLRITQHKWCNYGILIDGKTPCSAVTQMASSFPMNTCGKCQCGSSAQHSGKAPNAERTATVVEAILRDTVAPALGLTLKQIGHTQPESLDSSESPQKYQAMHATSSASSQLSSKLKSQKALSREHAAAHVKHPEKQRDVKQVQFQEPSSAEESDGPPGLCASSESEPEASYPTEQAMRQKERRKQRKELGQDVKKKKTFEVEPATDDCGENCKGISEYDADVETPADDHFVGILEDLDDMHHFHSTPSTSSSSRHQNRSYWLCKFLRSRHWLFGSSAPLLEPEVETCDMDSFLTIARNRRQSSQVDVIELFGGQGDTSRILLRRYNAVTGQNFDLVCGFNLLNSRHLRMLDEYIDEFQPVVAVMAPPCTSLKGWAGLNAVINHDTWSQNRAISIELGKLAARVALKQLRGNRHFFNENPKGSELYELPEWQEVLAHPAVVRCCFDQCRTGLRRRLPPCLPIQKPTEIVASDEILVKRLRRRQCNLKHEHAQIGGGTRRSDGRMPVSANSRETQLWPAELCSIIADSIQELLESHYVRAFYFPTVKAAPADDSMSKAAGARLSSCPACKGHQRAAHPSHTRGTDCIAKDQISDELACPGCNAIPEAKFGSPQHTMDGQCRWGKVTCPVCLAPGSTRASPGHTDDEHCRWQIAKTADYGRSRTGAHPRDGRVKASHDATYSLRPDAGDALARAASAAAPGTGGSSSSRPSAD